MGVNELELIAFNGLSRNLMGLEYDWTPGCIIRNTLSNYRPGCTLFDIFVGVTGLRLPFIHMGSYTEKMVVHHSTSPKIIGKLLINIWTWGSHQVQHGLELAICRFIQCIYQSTLL